MKPDEKADALIKAFDGNILYAAMCVAILIEVTTNADELITKLISIMPSADREYFKSSNESKASIYWKSVLKSIHERC